MRAIWDFDGVLCEYVGWRGHDNIGEPQPIYIEMVKDLDSLGIEQALSTTRVNPYPHGKLFEDKIVTSGEALEHIMDWLKTQGILECFGEITGYKPYGDFYIDDRGWLPKDKMELYYRIMTLKPDDILAVKLKNRAIKWLKELDKE
jgi:hypothetical protein